MTFLWFLAMHQVFENLQSNGFVNSIFQPNSWIKNVFKFKAMHQIDRELQIVGIVNDNFKAQKLTLKFFQLLAMQQLSTIFKVWE